MLLRVGADGCFRMLSLLAFLFLSLLLLCASLQLNGFYEARRDGLWYGYKYPMQESELKDGDVAITPEDDAFHAKAWNEKHPGHEWGQEPKGHGKKH